tara:strand:- start:271 stop:402 length:132 start_codon:yes stop_codon:yes gene_type:complete
MDIKFIHKKLSLILYEFDHESLVHENFLNEISKLTKILKKGKK